MWLTIIPLILVWGLWYLYPQAIAETIRHTKAQKTQRTLYHKVERHALIGILFLSLLSYSILANYPIKKRLPAPTPTEIITAQQTAPTPTLIVLTSPWSITTTINTLYLPQLEERGIKTITINTLDEAQNALPWFFMYNKRHVPLNILYTERHPYGLVLPDFLPEIDWQAALDTFEASPQKP